MRVCTWADNKVKTRTVWDIGVLKIFCVVVGLILGANFQTFVIQYQVWFLILGFILLFILMVRFFK